MKYATEDTHPVAFGEYVELLQIEENEIRILERLRIGGLNGRSTLTCIMITGHWVQKLSECGDEFS